MKFFLDLHLIYFIFAYFLFMNIFNCDTLHKLKKKYSQSFSNEMIYYKNVPSSIMRHRKISDSKFGPDIQLLFLALWDKLLEISNQTMINETLAANPQCFNQIWTTMTFNNTLVIDELISFSGKSFMDIGSEYECEEHGYNSYLFLEILIDPKNYNEEENFHNLYLFTDQTTFFLGLCLWRDCLNLYSKFFDANSNQIFFDVMNSTYGIKDIQYQPDPRSNISYSYNLVIFLCIIGIYLCFSLSIILLTFTMNMCERKSLDNIESEVIRLSQPKSESFILVEDQISQRNSLNKVKYPMIDHLLDSSYDDSSFSYNSEDVENVWTNKEECEKEIQQCVQYLKNIKNRKNGKNIKNMHALDKSSYDYSLQHDYSEKKSYRKLSLKTIESLESNKCLNCLKYLAKIFSVTHTFKYIFNVKNDIYDETNLELISGIRSYLMLWLVIDRLIVYLYSLSHDFGNLSFYTSFSFAYIKYANFAVESTIFLDGLIYAYKLISFLKREKTYSFLSFMKFYFNIVQKTVLFCILFFIFTVYVDEIANLTNKTYVFAYFYKLLKTEICIKDPYTILIPFFLQYFYDGPCLDYDYDNCLKYVYHALNEGYLMFFSCLLFFFLFKVKSQVADISISLLVSVNTLCCFIYYEKIPYTETYNLKYILGETRLIKQPHLLFFVFFIGINCGLSYFYYIDSVSNPDDYKQGKYIPFSYNFKFMNYLSRFTVTRRYFVGFSLLALQILICSFYPIIVNLQNSKNNLLIKFNFYIYLVFIYEKKVNILLFAGITMILLFSSETFWFNKLLKSRLFITFSRISFPFICVDIFVYYFFTMLYDTQLYWNSHTIMMISFALYCILVIVNFFLTAFFELPVRILYKKLTRKREQEITVE